VLRLSARADRNRSAAPDGRYAILDYKTGQVPTAAQVQSGLAPQLTLEGANLRAGQIPRPSREGGIARGSLSYISLRGGNPPGEEKPVALRDSTPDAEADKVPARAFGRPPPAVR